MQYPLQFIATTPVDSNNNYAVQCCDILAGLTTRSFVLRLDGEDRKGLDEVNDAGLDAIADHGPADFSGSDFATLSDRTCCG